MNKVQLALVIALVAIAGYLYKQNQSHIIAFTSKENSVSTSHKIDPNTSSVITQAILQSQNPLKTAVSEKIETLHEKQVPNTPQTHIQKSRPKVSKKQQNKEAFILHVSGAIKQPGVYSFKTTQALYQIIQAAGGPLPHAALDSLDLSETFSEPQKITIPFQKIAIQAQSSANSSAKININQASQEQLCQLPGIGPKTAAAILSLRQTGRFKSLKELEKVKGLGPKKIAKLKAFIQF